jgi:group I intron endonuclease
MINNFYTYAYLRQDRTPYYIGKGSGKRIYSKQRGVNAPKDKSRIIFLKKNLTEAEAFKHEVYMIAVLGRKDLGTGILRNLTNGGEGASGHVKSEEAKKKISEANTGKIRTEEAKKKMSKAKIGKKPHNFGVHHTGKTKKKISEAVSGKKHPRYGRTGALCPCSKAIIAIKPDGTELHFGSVIDAARELGVDAGNLSSYYLKNGKSARWGKLKDWKFFYKTL